ncbi:hypothetical protein [Phytoactinopolyspora mesophila]|uniref:Uncharacterized protein n=1 Tax=Phytoactinopolyspora mesophila TaxID=2650750 RepID=A0A7K3M7D8_9ACTN|nr:hypothetical protein [Phytoactinopolyspora mesophila]NDL58842.1 hypothetical protein [Phytoactinopolyspora mesophila]
MRVGRDVHDRLRSRIQSSLKIAPGEHIELIVRLNGKKPAVDCLVVTNARVLTLDSTAEPLTWIRRQALADEIRTWRLTRKFRSRLTVTSGYGRTDVFGSSLTVFDDDLVDEHLTALVSNRAKASTVSAVKALRAEAHWMSSAYGRAVYVLDRDQLAPGTAEVIDIDMVERQLSQFDYWPSSEVRRHLAACLPGGGCFLANADPAEDSSREPGPVPTEHVEAVLSALVTVDSAKIKRSEGTESYVFHQLMSVVAQIRAMPTWNSHHLDEHHLRVDLDDEVRRIALRCHEIAGLRAEIGDKPEGFSETGRRAAAVRETSLASLDAVASRLEDRVSLLAAYRDRLRALSRELADLDSATHIAGVAERVASLATSAGDAEPGSHLDGLLPQPREAADALPEVLASVREEVDRLCQQDGHLVS